MPTKRTDVAARLTAETSAFERGTRRAGRAVKGLAGKVERAGRRMRTAMRNTGMGNVAGRLKGWGTSIAAFAGVYGIGQAVHSIRQFEDGLADLAIRGSKDMAWMDGQRKKVLRLSETYGTGKEEILSFALRYTELTGNATMAMDVLEDMTKVGVATGANMKDLADVLNTLAGSFGITGKEAAKAFDILRQQEKLGAIGFQDLARLLPEISGIAKTFGKSMSGMQGLKAIGGLLQVTQWTAGGAAESGTASKRFLEELVAKREKIEGVIGKQLATGAGEWLPMDQVFKAIGEAMSSPETAEKLSKIFNIRSIKAARALGIGYGAGTKGGTIGVGGREAAATILGASGRGDINRDLAKRMQTPGQQWRKAMEMLTNQMHRTLLPAVKSLSKHMPTVAKVVGWVVSNIGLLMKAWVAWKATKFFTALAGAPGGINRIAASAGGAYGPGGQVGRMYGTRGAAGAATPGATALGSMKLMAQNIAITGVATLAISGVHRVLKDFLWDPRKAKEWDLKRARMAKTAAELGVSPGKIAEGESELFETHQRIWKARAPQKQYLAEQGLPVEKLPEFGGFDANVVQQAMFRATQPLVNVIAKLQATGINVRVASTETPAEKVKNNSNTGATR